MIPGAANPLLLASAQAGAAYNIERSIRLNAPDSAFLSRTPSVAGNRKTWTWAGWVKRSVLGAAYKMIFSAGVSATECGLRFTNSPADALEFYQYSGGGFNWQLVTTQVFRDPSSWYHIVAAVDSTQATSSDRAKLYVNGVQVTAFGTASYPTSNYDSLVSSTTEHGIGRVSASQYFDGYLADVHFIDGQTLDPTSFGEFDANGVWQPKAYTGSYPGNSFHLPFSDNSTAAALGTDTSGNSNNWTVNNISVAAGAGNDSLVDTPTNYGTDDGLGGSVRGNYCTWNPLVSTNSTSNGNLDCSGVNTGACGTIGGLGKYYFECTSGSSGSVVHIGIVDISVVTASVLATSSGGWLLYRGDGRVFDSVSQLQTGLTNYTAGDVVGVAFDTDANTVQFYLNGSTLGTPLTLVSGKAYAPFVHSSTGTIAYTLNCGQRPFAYPAPSGFKALCTTNLPEPQTVTTSGSYTGNGLADGPFVYLNGVPTAMTVNGTAVTFGTHADKLSNGFKLRTTSTTYNQNAATYNYSVTSTGPTFKTARAQAN